jgi:hypothetical protein
MTVSFLKINNQNTLGYCADEKAQEVAIALYQNLNAIHKGRRARRGRQLRRLINKYT